MRIQFMWVVHAVFEESFEASQTLGLASFEVGHKSSDKSFIFYHLTDFIKN